MRQYFDNNGQAIHYERGTYTRTSEADFDEWSTVPVGWAEVVDAPTVNVPTMPPAIARLNERNAAYMGGDGNAHCGKTFGRIVQSWRAMAHEDAKLAHNRHDHIGEGVQLALMWAGNDD